MAQRGRSVDRQSGRPAPPGRLSKGPTSPKPAPVDTVAVRDVIEPAVLGTGYELEDLSVKGVGRRHLVRVIIDGDGSLGLDAIARVSRAVSQALDAAEEGRRPLLPGEYQLEVSSPGVDRPLTRPAHWRRNVGRSVKVKAQDKTVTGRITAADDHTVTFDVAGETRSFAYGDLGPGRVQIEFSRLEAITDEELDEFEELEDEEEER